MRSVTKNQSVKKTSMQFFKSKFVEFCKTTELHGFKYIVMEELNSVERIFWAIAVLVSVICAGFLVTSAYWWYARNPIVTVIESTQGAIWDVPFPAVSICDLNIISRKAAFSLAKNLSITNHVNNEFIFETLRYVPLLHSTNIATLKMKRNLRILQDILDFNNISIESLFRRLSPTASCKDLLQRCMWKNSVYRCEQLFQQIFTTVSLCCVFNYFALPSDRRSNSDLIPMPKPRRVASCGYQTALEVLISTDYDDYYSNNIVSSGALVLIDNAYNMPDLDSTVRLINPSTEVLIALSPEQTYTTPGVKSFKPEERQCYYHDEIKIGDFLQYSFHNCMAYQKIEIIKKSCHCIPFYFPKRSKVPASDLEMRKELLKEYVECLPECEHFDYPLEVALGNIANDVPLNGLPFYQNINLKNRSILNVFFNDLVSTRYRRDVYLNWQNILASFGGLLSLMLGFTLISGIDLVLFFVFRIFYDFISRPRKVMSTIIHVQEAPQERIRKNKKNIYDIHRSFMDMQNQ